MKLLIGTLLMVFMVHQPSVAVDRIHSCLPGSFPGVCVLTHVYYNRSAEIKHIFPQNYSEIRIGSEGWSKAIDSIVTIFDGQLHAELGHPQIVEIFNSKMKTLEIPRKLRHVNFADNMLNTFWMEKGDAEPLLSYLDLGRNRISNLTNITTFINLETLYLNYNNIKELDLDVFKNLTKLKYLNLNYNYIDKLSGNFPPSLKYLALYNTDLKTLDYNGLQLPALETLNIEENLLTTIDAARLLLGLPKLKMLRLGNNHFSHETLLDALSVLRAHNVSFQNDMDEASCYYDKEVVEGVCVGRETIGKGWLKPTLLSLLTIAIAVVFVLTMRWVYIAMFR